MTILLMNCASVPAGKLLKTAVHRLRSISALVLCIYLGMIVPSEASIITFDLLGDSAAAALDNKAEGQLQHGALSAHLRVWAFPGNEGLFNQTAHRFGINTTGTTSDSSSLIDSFNGMSEGLFISFNADVLLEHLVLSLFSPGEEAHLSLPGQPFGMLEGLDSAFDHFQLDRTFLAAGENILLGHRQGNGFGLVSFAVSRVAVTEPITGALALIVVPLLILGHKRNTTFT